MLVDDNNKEQFLWRQNYRRKNTNQLSNANCNKFIRYVIIYGVAYFLHYL